MGRERETEWKKYRLCGVMLLLITLALFTFISLATAIINALRCRGGFHARF